MKFYITVRILMKRRSINQTKILRSSLVILILWITCGYATAQSPHLWRTVNLHPENGRLNSVDLDSSGLAVAVGENGLVEVSNDTGSHWSTVSIPVKSTLNAVTMIEPITIVAAGDSGYVLRSTNGQNWTAFQIDPNERFTGLSSDLYGNVYLVSESGVVRKSSDKGVTWTKKGPKFGQSLLAVKSPSSSIVIVSGTKGLEAHSIDGGLNWKVDTLTSVNLGHIAVAGTSAWYVAGEKWSLFRSSDTGQSWQKIVVVADTVGFGNAEFHDLGFFSRDTGILFVRYDGLGYFDQYSTIDGGLTWKTRNDPSFGSASGFATPHRDISLICGGNGGIRRTTNAGHSWRKVDPVTDFSHNLLAFTNTNLGITCGTTFGQLCFYVTQDGGLSWNKVDCLQTTRRPLTISFPNAALCIAAGDSGSIFRSTNAGQSWMQSALSDSGIIGAIRMYDGSIGILFEGNPNSIKRTTDGGVSWTAIPSPFVNDQLGISTFNYLSDHTVLALASDSHVYRSDDGGLTWQKHGSLPFQGDHMVFVDSLQGWASAEQDIIMMTKDGGAHWTTQLNKGTDGLTDLAFSNSAKGIAVGFAMTIFETTNGGTSWIQIRDSLVNQDLTLAAIAFPSPARAIGVTSYGLIIIADYGASGVQSTLSHLSDLAVFPNPAISPGYVSFVATENGITQIELTNILGEILSRDKTFLKKGRVCEVHLRSGLPTGAYTIIVQSPSSISKVKFLLTR